MRALSDQVARLIHVSNVYRVKEQEVLSDRLAALSPAPVVVAPAAAAIPVAAALN